MEPKKPLYLSQHAKDKVAERQVALEMVQETMQKNNGDVHETLLTAG